jgi:hypothetical protein
LHSAKRRNRGLSQHRRSDWFRGFDEHWGLEELRRFDEHRRLEELRGLDCHGRFDCHRGLDQYGRVGCRGLLHAGTAERHGRQRLRDALLGLLPATLRALRWTPMRSGWRFEHW